MTGQGQHTGFALTLAQSAHTPHHCCHCTVTMHTAQSLILALRRLSAVVEYIIFYNLKEWKTISGPIHTATNSLAHPHGPHTLYTVYPLKLIYIYIICLCKILLHQLLLVIISINNLMYIILTHLYYKKINLLNHIIKNKNKNKF